MKSTLILIEILYHPSLNFCRILYHTNLNFYRCEENYFNNMAKKIEIQNYEEEKDNYLKEYKKNLYFF